MSTILIQPLLDKIKTKEQNKEIDDIKNVYDLLKEEKWNQLTVESKKYLLTKLLLIESFELNIKNTPKLEYFDSDDATGGLYRKNKNTIFISNRVLIKYPGIDAFGLLCHELIHTKQGENMTDKIYKMYFEQPICELNFCDFINKKCILHIDAIAEIFDKSEMFYYLTKPEREAYEYESKKANNLLRTTKYYNRFRKIYQLQISNQEIDEIIDDSFINLIDKINPQTPYREIKASVMYDLCIIGQFLYSKDISIINLFMESKKSEILSKYGYLNSNINKNKYEENYNKTKKRNDIEME